MKYRYASLLLFPVLLAACSDDAAGPSGDRLTREEAMMIAGEVSGSVATTSAAPRMSTGQDGTMSVPTTFTQEHESSHPCPRGGAVSLSWRVDGTVDPEVGLFELDVVGSHKPAGCAYMHEALTLTITGDPDLDFAAHVAVSNNQPSEPFTASITGAFNWSASDGRTGRCTVDYEEVTDFVARKRTVEGDVCGHTVKETFTWS